jgi:hypothetical protein
LKRTLFWDMTPCSLLDVAIKFSSSIFAILAYSVLTLKIKALELNSFETSVNIYSGTYWHIVFMRIEKVHSSETSWNLYQTLLRSIPEDSTHHPVFLLHTLHNNLFLNFIAETVYFSVSQRWRHLLFDVFIYVFLRHLQHLLYSDE